MTDALARPEAPAAAPAPTAAEIRLRRRYAAERRFVWYGRLAIIVALSFLAVLLGRVVQQGYTAMWTHAVEAPVTLDPARIDPNYVEGANYDMMAAEGLLRALRVPDDGTGEAAAELKDLLSPDIGLQVMRQVQQDRSLIGRTVTITAPLSDDADLYFKGHVHRSEPEDARNLTNAQLDRLDAMRAQGLVASRFNSGLFTRADSTQPELAGVLGAVVGSLLMLMVTALLAIPVGVMTAVYLEEFAPKNRFTDIIEVNINNLAAVPSIVYGLLGLAVFINWMGLPRASPLVGGLVLALMALPTIIIATRSSLKAVPPSIREAALGVGASRTQTVFGHVLPLAMPGVMTGTIIAMAHALGETAPLLMIGMVSFVPAVNLSLTGASTVLPVQIFIWENAAERGFHERTAAAIIVLLLFMILMNAIAILLRRRFERRW